MAIVQTLRYILHTYVLIDIVIGKVEARCQRVARNICPCTDKKENKIFLIYKEIQMGSGAKRKGFLIYEERHKYFHHI
jgi:hypothetical protein